jgi:signal transduction histidine kinase/response regulator RpfG family c-di-GMP phosphodiesterase
MIATVRRSISKKFMLAVLVTTFSALAATATAILLLDIQAFRTASVNDLTTQSNILAKISVPALEFNDHKVAQENLAQLQSRRGVTAAAIYAPDGSRFATYVREGGSDVVVPARAQRPGYAIDGDQITMFRQITRGGDVIGTVFMSAQYPLAERVQRYSIVLAGAMLGGLLVAFLVSAWLQAAVTRPIRALTAAVHQVIRRRDFSARVTKSTEDEVGLLVDAFNTMLGEVGERAEALERSNGALQREMQERTRVDEALRQLNTTLEERIVDRTTELERAHEQLRQSQKLEAVGQLTGGVAHDFNNVLQVIMSNLQMLQMTLAGHPEAQRRLEAAAFAADRGAKLSSQLLAFARRQPLQPVSVNLGRILRGMDELLRRALGETVHIETVVAGGLWSTMVDPHQLENVVLNLAINARDAMKGNGRLTLELGNAMLDDQYVANERDVPAGQYVMMAISDSGCGMPPDVLQRAFEPFFTTKREGEGTGLGLSMAYGFVKQSAGHIRIYSEVNAGTTIKIYLPRCHQPEAELNEAPPERAVGGIETILVVEDDAAVQATTVDILSALGYRVLKANDGQSALTVLQSGIPIDMLFTDVVMPGPVRSPELARQAKALMPQIEVLYTSGYTQNAIVHDGRLDPGVELISKPYRREDLARKIRAMFAKKRPVAVAPAQMPAHVPGEAASNGGLRLLVVEDNDDSREITSELLAMLGHRVQSAASAEAALALPDWDKIDALLTDINLPNMSGIELARTMLAKAPRIRVVLASGYGQMSLGELGFAAEFLPKPFDMDAMRALLARLASRQGAAAAM